MSRSKGCQDQPLYINTTAYGHMTHQARQDPSPLTQLPAAYGVVPQNGDGRVLEVTAATNNVRQEGQGQAAHAHEALQRPWLLCQLGDGHQQPAMARKLVVL